MVLHWDPFLSKPNGVPYLHDGWGRHGSGGRLLPLPAALPAPVPGEAGGGGWKKHRKLRRMKVEGGEWMVESGGRQGWSPTIQSTPKLGMSGVKESKWNKHNFISYQPNWTDFRVKY